MGFISLNSNLLLGICGYHCEDYTMAGLVTSLPWVVQILISPDFQFQICWFPAELLAILAHPSVDLAIKTPFNIFCEIFRGILTL